MGANGHNENWFVQFRGHSLGPITTDQLLSSLKQQELGPDDKVASSRDRAWRPLSTYPEFSAYLAAIHVKRPTLHEPPPPAETLLKKKKKKAAVKKSGAEAPTPAPESAVADAAHVPAILPEPEPESKPAPELKSAKNSSPVPSRPQLDFSKTPMPQIDQLALLEVFRDWKKKSEPKPEPLPALASTSVSTSTAKSAPVTSFAFEEPKEPRQEINLKIDLRFNQKTMLALALIGLIVAVAAIYYPRKKTGDSESSRLPSPPSPTMQPSSQGDPIPSLKAPTRPQRE